MQIGAKDAVTNTSFKYVFRVIQASQFFLSKPDLRGFQQLFNTMDKMHQDFFPNLGITPQTKGKQTYCLYLMSEIPFYLFCVIQRPQFHVFSL